MNLKNFLRYLLPIAIAPSFLVSCASRDYNAGVKSQEKTTSESGPIVIGEELVLQGTIVNVFGEYKNYIRRKCTVTILKNANKKLDVTLAFEKATYEEKSLSLESSGMNEFSPKYAISKERRKSAKKSIEIYLEKDRQDYVATVKAYELDDSGDSFGVKNSITCSFRPEAGTSEPPEQPKAEYISGPIITDKPMSFDGKISNSVGKYANHFGESCTVKILRKSDDTVDVTVEAAGATFSESSLIRESTDPDEPSNTYAISRERKKDSQKSIEVYLQKDRKDYIDTVKAYERDSSGNPSGFNYSVTCSFRKGAGLN